MCCILCVCVCVSRLLSFVSRELFCTKKVFICMSEKIIIIRQTKRK
jgi:hypothetical protein